MDNVFNEIKKALEGLTGMATETTSTLTGLNLFIRALVAELRATNPDLLDAVINRIESTDTQMLDTEGQIKGKEYALVLARSS